MGYILCTESPDWLNFLGAMSLGAILMLLLLWLIIHACAWGGRSMWMFGLRYQVKNTKDPFFSDLVLVAKASQGWLDAIHDIKLGEDSPAAKVQRALEPVKERLKHIRD